jgi:uncharacterized DUF497 family protein
MRSHLPAADFAERKPAPSPVENGQIAAFGLATYENGRMLSNMEFEWDATKAAANLGKHGVSFERATLVFDDPARLTVVDTRHPTEGRENTTGTVGGLVLLTVTHTDRAGVTRLISARPASRSERNFYHAPR